MTARKISCLLLTLNLTLVVPLVAFSQAEEEPTQTEAAEQVEQRIDPLAAVLTVMNIPARGVLCGATGVLAAIVMGASAGRRYADAARMMEGGCSGPWVITPEMIEESRSKQKSGDDKSSPGEKRP